MSDGNARDSWEPDVEKSTRPVLRVAGCSNATRMPALAPGSGVRPAGRRSSHNGVVLVGQPILQGYHPSDE
jgi:hypothetical protein